MLTAGVNGFLPKLPMWGQTQASPGVIKTGGIKTGEKHNTAKCVLFIFIVTSFKRVTISREVSEGNGE